MSSALAQLEPTVSETLAGWSLLERAQGFSPDVARGIPGLPGRSRVDTREGRVEGRGDRRVRSGAGCRARGGRAAGTTPRERVRAWLLEHIGERTPGFFKGGNGRFPVHQEVSFEAPQHKIAEVGYQQHLAQQISTRDVGRFDGYLPPR